MTNTETVEAAETAQKAPDAPEAADVENAPETTTQEPANGNREAAKYRRQLRDTETERDTLAARLEALQKQTVETFAAQHLDKPAGLWASGTELADLIDVEGNVDPDKVKAAAVAAREELGLTKPRGLIIPDQGKTPTKGPNLNTWEAAFSPETR